MTERAPERWVEAVERRGDGLIASDPLSRAEQADEALLMGLRLDEGIDLDRLERIGGMRPNPAVIADLVDQDQLADLDGGRRIKVTPSGRMVLNELVLRLSASFMHGAREQPIRF